MDTTTGYVKAPPTSGPPRSSSRSRRRRSSRSPSSRRRRSSPSESSRRSRRRRSSRSASRSASPSRAPDGFAYSKSSPYAAKQQQQQQQADRAYPSFDPRDTAPEDGPGQSAAPTRGPLDPRSSLVRGSLRLEGVNFAKYEGAKPDPDRQRAFTSALRDDLISEAGNGVVREDILLRITPGPIKTVVLDYNGGQQADGQPGVPSLVDAEWCIDCEYAISARDEERQVSIAQTLFEALTAGDLRMESTKKAYTRYLNPEHPDTHTIKVVPTSSNEPRAAASPGVPAGLARASPLHRSGLYEEGDPLEGRFTWHQRRSMQDLSSVRTLPDSPAPLTPGAGVRSPEVAIRSVGGVPVENRPLPDPALLASPSLLTDPTRSGAKQPWWDTRPSYELERALSRDRDFAMR